MQLAKILLFSLKLSYSIAECFWVISVIFLGETYFLASSH